MSTTSNNLAQEKKNKRSSGIHLVH
uniref:Uncharacterized protein n=1 Tax=Rhizophora mucronata TaxID=61149 RepID=A0A2P2IJB6_RHIMU